MDQMAQKQRYRARVAHLVDKACQVIRCRLDEFRAQCKPEYVCPVKQPPPSVHYPAVRCRRTIVVAKVRVWVRLVIRQWRQATAQCQLEKREERLQHKSARKVRAVSRWFARRPHPKCDVQIQGVVRRNNARAARKALLILRRQAVTVLERAFIHHRQQRLLWLATALLPVWRRYNTARKQVLWHAVGQRLAVARTTGEAAARRRHKAMSTLVRAFTRMVVRAKVARAVAAAARRKTTAARCIHAVWWRHRFLRMRRRAAARRRRAATTTVHKVVRRFIRRVRADIAVRRFWWGRVNAEFEAMLAHFKATKESRYVGKLAAHLQQKHQSRTCCGR